MGLQGSFAAYPAGVPGVVAALVALAVVVVVFLNLRHVATLMHGEEAAAGLGAALALAADLAVRLLLPQEMPVNVLLSLVGGPGGWVVAVAACT